jgi:cation:H+ antiporter
MLLVLMVLDGHLSQVESAILFALVVGYTIFIVRQSRAETKASGAEAPPPATGWDRHWSVQVLLIIAGLALLVVGSNLLVDAAIEIAKALGVSDMVIGLTIVAAGTSLPEVATSVMATIRGERDIAIGNVIGSNTFNILACLGASGLVADGGLGVAKEVLAFDIWVMLGVAAATIPLFITGYVITRLNGLLLLGFYVAYTLMLVMTANGDAGAADIGNAMMRYVLPGTVVLLVVMMLRYPHKPESPPGV